MRILIGLAFAMLVVDVLALTCAVIPLAASQRKRAEPAAFSPRLTQNPVDQALILPTHDPRKPWVTRTPRPTATPWAAIRTPLPEATLRPEPAAVGLADSISPTSSPSVDVASASNPSLIHTASAEIILTDIPTTAAVLPTETLAAPASTPGPNQLQGTDQPLPPIVPGDQAQFTTYVMDQYGTIAGQALNIAAITLDTTDEGAARVVVELTGDDANNGFAAQTAATALDYGHRLLNDLKYYFNGQNCVIEVASTYVTSNGDACLDNPAWCVLDIFDSSAKTWTVIRTYVRGTSFGGSDGVETSNTGQ